MKEKEIRLLAENLNANEEEMVVEGYAVVFNIPATHGFTEIVDKNAFNGCDMKDVCLKYNHDDSHLILARTRNNSLQLNIDDKGLFIRANLIDTSTNKDIFKMIKAGLLDKMSFAFTVSAEDWDYDTDTRRIMSIDKLFDVSIVDVPFYDTTSIYARSLESLEKGKRELDNLKEQKRVSKLKIETKIKLMGLEEK